MQTFLHSTASNRMTKMISICRDCWSRDLNPLGTLISALQCHDKSDTSGCCTSLCLTFSSTSVWLASIPHHAAKARTSALDCGNFSQHVRRLCNERTAFAQVKQQEESHGISILELISSHQYDILNMVNMVAWYQPSCWLPSHVAGPVGYCGKYCDRALDRLRVVRRDMMALMGHGEASSVMFAAEALGM